MLKTESLTLQAKGIIVNKATEHCHSGFYNDTTEEGTYLCKNCGVALFRSNNKFDSGSGWPSFDSEISDMVSKVEDIDQVRTEILCKRCNAHLGHIFYGEQHTELNTRYCVNSLALEFVPNNNVNNTEEAIVAAGCFWGVEHMFQNLDGVLKTEVGYTGGSVDSPIYELVCSGKSGHVEAIRIVFDPEKLKYEGVIKYFFEIHDFSQDDGQGNDIGEQYLSKIFYFNEAQRITADSIINMLKDKGYKVATALESVRIFWPAEDYHQMYYSKSNGEPYCHVWKKIF